MNDAMENVVILTPTVISSSQLQVLSKGLNFVPTARFNLFDTLKNVNRFVRALTVKRNFLDEEASQSLTQNTNYHETHEDFIPLSFREQKTLIDLQDLQREDFMSENSLTEDMVRFSTTNSSFYPKSSRVPILDDFQHLVEHELTMLHDQNVSHRRKKHRI